MSIESVDQPSVRHRGGAKTAEHYEGIPIHAAPGVHHAVAQEVRAVIGTLGRVLDLGAGQGALSQRLSDMGFDVIAVDITVDDWAARDVQCIVVDLDESWLPLHAMGPFDAVCAVEVIEHVENPRDFLRQVLRLPLADNAPVVVTTPNPLDTFSCITLFTRGWFNWFSPAHYQGGGHISILPFWMVDKHFEHLGQPRGRWRYVSAFRHRSGLRRMFYGIVSTLRRTVAKSADRAHFDGETAIGTFRFKPTASKAGNGF
jgi:SAM-dependent methyltransferase